MSRTASLAFTTIGELLEHLGGIDPKSRTVTVYDAPGKSTRISEDETLTGGTLLPGFELPLRELFAKVPAAPAQEGK